ncbi:Gfo/Idh/MocA family oxidoreductase [Gordonia sp. TBRC 11910]|uniref:Gfo/Idh/MocA family oxidoreductase n=1 Tax=Gordonia asplenii TaxID=2725283 RepID=A0A848L1N6_9ACTN|nr:Gfo/Idh/MocA family oxidoreductase [Gordonia asplenii]NMO02431.1 Gfo/Idh/MocA family oxidoreductase [Gordonia asplenii]
MNNTSSIGVAVIGAGMAGKAHAAGYRSATAVFGDNLPEIRLVSIADAYEPLAVEVAKRFGFARHDTSWQAIVDADDIDVVSVVVANALHREIVEALLAAGKHVLCEKPLAGSIADAEAMVDAAASSDAVARIGLTYLRSPGIAFLGDLVRSGRLGKFINFDGEYWTDYACDPNGPISWRFKGAPGSGALADVGSHLSYIAELFGGPIASVRGGTLHTTFDTRPKPVGRVIGHEHAEVSAEREVVENDDVAGFFVDFADGGTGSLQVSRVAAGHPNTLKFEVFCERGTAAFDFRKPGQVEVTLLGDEHDLAGPRTVTLGPAHPYWSGGLAMDACGVGIGQNDGFVFQARAFLEEVAGVAESESLPRNADFAEGLHNMLLLDAVARSARGGGTEVSIPDAASLVLS